MKWASSLSENPETGAAVKEAAASLLERLAPDTPYLVFLFASEHHRDRD